MIEEVEIENITKEMIPLKGSFSNFQIQQQTIENLKKNKFECLYPIQIHTFDFIYKAQNVLARDHTGSGKTLAFLLPLLEQYRSRGLLKSKTSPGPKALIISPTRELANQIKDVLESLKYSSSEFNNATIYGGQKNMIEQKMQLEKSPDFVVGTPGRIKAMLENGKFRAENVESIVLDEADQLLEIGFDKDILEIHEKIMEQKTKPNLQVICFSATFNSVLGQILSKFSDQVFYKVDLVGNSDKQSPSLISHIYCKVRDDGDKCEMVKKILEKEIEGNEQCIIFVNRKDETQRFYQELENRNIKVLSGDVPQLERERIYKMFKEKKLQFLIATNVAARGLDINGVGLIIQVGPPQDLSTYIHRAGRTGRCNKSGKSIMIVSFREIRKLKEIEQNTKVVFEEYDTGDNQSQSSQQSYIGKRGNFQQQNFREKQNNQGFNRGNSQKPSSSSSELYFSGLPNDIEQSDLEDFCSKQAAKPLRIKLVSKPNKPQIAFISMSSTQDADSLIRIKNPQLKNQRIKIEYSKPAVPGK